MSDQFMSSEEYDERSHALYNAGQFDAALALLKEGLERYPLAVDLHVGAGYARLAQEEYAWARRSFEEALILDPEQEDALAGLGEVLLKFGQTDLALRAFERTLVLGYEDDSDLMLQIGRALFREGYIELSMPYFEKAARNATEPVEAVSCIGYALHRLGDDAGAIETLRRALSIGPGFAEARVYLANLLYDSGDLDAALNEFSQTSPEDHWEELGILRFIELRKSIQQVPDNDPSLEPWKSHLEELASDMDDIDTLLMEVEWRAEQAEMKEEMAARRKLETFGTLLTDLTNQQQAAVVSTAVSGEDTQVHRVAMQDGTVFEGTWEEIVCALRDKRDAGRPIDEYMALEARRYYGATGKQVDSHAPEAFIKASAAAGMLLIIH